MSKVNKDMCNGPLLKQMIIYTIPIILTGVLQLLFNAADLVIVGRFGTSGSNAVAAVGATGSLTNLMLNFFIGCSVGSGVAVAQAIGSRDKERIHRSIHTAIPVAIISGLFLSIVGVLYSKKMLELMSTPEEILDLSALYMKIYFSGMVFSLVYNFGASILRAIGETKKPLIYLIISGVVNVILNIIFVTVFHMDVAGVALATIISQALSAILVIITLMRRDDYCKLELTKMKIHPVALQKILMVGVPAGIQGCMFSISNVIIQSSINSLSYIPGLVAGSAAAGSIEGFVYITLNGFYHTAMNYTGQNFGAGKIERIKKIVGISLILVIVTGIITGLLVNHYATQILSLYITDSPDAINQGAIRMTILVLPYFLCGMMEIATGTLRGMGVSVTPMIMSILGVCGIRIMWIFTVFQIPQFHTPESLYISYPISWLATFIFQFIALIFVYKKKKKQNSDQISVDTI